MYRLRAELRAHEADVRGVAVSQGGLIATASRDKTIGLWELGNTEPIRILRGHSHFVNDVIFVDLTTLVSASNDNTLRVWNTDTGECLHVLEGHSASVCAISVVPSGSSRLVVSSSWDCTARVWDVDFGRCMRELIGHSAAVWKATGISDGRIITVSADKQVRVWDAEGLSPRSRILPTVHTDVVRDVVIAPSGCFTTVANDSLIVMWSRIDELFAEASRLIDAHDGSYIYSIDAHETPDGNCTFFTGGEDNALRISTYGANDRRGLVAGQVIMHPGTVWSVAVGVAQDVVSACSDGVARVFTLDENAVADKDVLKAFEKAVSERQVNSKVIGGVDVAKLPDAENALAVSGKKDGENKIVKTADGKAEVHMWSASESRWTKVGDVVDGPSGSASLGKGNIRGKSFDFVFEVEIGEGGKKEKLGYNRGENPYLAAQRFIDDNELSPEFLDQIAQFIEQQVPPDALQSTENAPSDPLTGGSRYVPGGGTGAAGGSAGGDPLTGRSRYVPSHGETPPPTLPPPRKLIPHSSGFITYKGSDQLEKIQQKLSEFNAELSNAGSDKALSIDEAAIFGQSLIPKLRTRSGVEMILEDKDCEIVEKMLNWPTSHVFAAMDIARLVIAIPSGGAYFFGKHNGQVLNNVLHHMAASEATGPVYIMGCRFLCNMFGNRVVGDVVGRHMDDVLRVASAASRNSNRRARETFASLLINFAVMMHDSKAEIADRSVIVNCAVQLISGGERDEEVLYRLLIALGTAMCDDKYATKRGVELGAAQAAAEAAPVSPRLQQIALEIATLIAA